MKKLFILAGILVFLAMSLQAKILVIAPGKADLLEMNQVLAGEKVDYWFLQDKGPITGDEVFKYVGKGDFVIRVVNKSEKFTDDESMILEDFLSSRGSLLLLGYTEQKEFFEFPLLKDYILVEPIEKKHIDKVIELFPQAKDVFGKESIFVKGDLISLGLVPEAPDFTRWGYTDQTGKKPYCAVVKSCTFKTLYFPFAWNDIATMNSKKALIKSAIKYLTKKVSKVRLPSVGTVMKDFELVDLNGNTQSLSQYYGKKAVVLAYFATWCSHCQKEIPLLQEYNDSTAPYQLLAASFHEEKKLVEDFVAKYGITFPVMADEKGVLRRLYRIPSVPTLFFISKDGVLEYLHRGEISRELLEQKLNELVNTKSEYKNQELLLNRIINGGACKLKKYVK